MIEQTGIDSLVNATLDATNRAIDNQAAWKEEDYGGVYNMFTGCSAPNYSRWEEEPPQSNQTAYLPWSEGTWDSDYDNLQFIERNSRSVRFDNTVAWSEHEHGVEQLTHSLTAKNTISSLELRTPSSQGQYDIDYDAIYVRKRGSAYRQSQIVKHSWYNRTPGSPIWGDADKALQIKAIDALVTASIEHGLSAHQTAYVLATAHVESGFNPHASAGTTSACGLGQFVDNTGKSYGINDNNRWDISVQANALVEHFLDNKAIAQRRSKPEAYIYKYHHDGENGESGGLHLSQIHVMPKIRGIHHAIANVFY